MDFQASKLGTKEHWDEAYAREIQQYESIGDEGEVWFGEDAVEEMVEWVGEHLSPNDTPEILDIGCGNGHLLFALCDHGFSPSTMTGIDYSENSIVLCQNIAKSRQVDGIRWQRCDCLEPNPDLGQFTLALDKGTYDAISLTPVEDGAVPPRQQYISAIASLLKPKGQLVLTSCNWTEAELKEHFTAHPSEPKLSYHSHISRPTFTFGGQKGSTIATVIFQRD